MRDVLRRIDWLAYPVVCVCAGTVAAGLVLLYLSQIAPTLRGNIDPYHFPFALLVGGVIGLLTAAGYQAGQTFRLRYRGAESSYLRGINQLCVVMAALYAISGAVFGALGNNWSPGNELEFVCLFMAGVPVLLGVLSGLSDRPARFSFIFGLFIGPVAGLIFGLAGGIAYTVTPQTNLCTTSHCFPITPAVVAGVLTITMIIAGLAVSFVAVCAQAAGLQFAASRSQRHTLPETEEHIPPLSGLDDNAE